MKDEPKSAFDSIDASEHEYYCILWKLVKSGELENLEGKRKILGQLMLEHLRYQYFWEIPYTFVETEIQEALEREGVNPDFHLAIEGTILEQIVNRDPSEVYEAYEALLRIGQEAHEARHIIGRVYTEMLYDLAKMVERDKQPNEDFYIDRIRYLTKHPKKVIKDQIRKLQKRL